MSPTGRIANRQPDMQTLVPRTEVGDRLRSAFAEQFGTRWLQTGYSDLEHRVVATMTDEERKRMKRETGL